MTKIVLSVLLVAFAFGAPIAHAGAGSGNTQPEFKTKVKEFPVEEEAAGITGMWEKITYRAGQQPFLPVASVIFLCAIIHSFFTVPITRYAHKVQHAHDAQVRREKGMEGRPAMARDMVSFKATMLHFLGEIEAVFGIWGLVLMFAIAGFYDVGTAENYILTVNFTEPMFVVVIMVLASTRPVLRFAENTLRFFARFGNETPAAWWLSILIVAPILGSFITEPGAMTIAAILLAKKFYSLSPSKGFAYGTLGLLFVNISVGGVLTNFAAPPVLMVRSAWELTTPEMLVHYGSKAVVGIVVSTVLYYLFFRRELVALGGILPDTDGDGRGDLQEDKSPVPPWVTGAHLLFMALTVYFSHTPAIFVGGFLFFLAFRQATEHHQSDIHLRGPILVGFFLGGLVIHGGLQGWWLEPVISSLSEAPLFIGSAILTSFNDNAAITFLASQVDGLGPSLKYAVLAGAVSGGGLTVIANAPNPAGQALLAHFFGTGVSPARLFLAASVPTVVVSCALLFIPDPAKEKMFEMDDPAPKVEHVDGKQGFPD